jgi:hypothetical protein
MISVAHRPDITELSHLTRHLSTQPRIPLCLHRCLSLTGHSLIPLEVLY